MKEYPMKIHKVEKETNREEFFEYLRKNGSNFTINQNPTEEEIEYIRKQIEKAKNENKR